MAKANLEVPDYIIKQIESVEKNSRKMMEEMVKAGAEVTYKQVVSNMPDGIKKSNMRHNLKITRVYDTKSDGAINCKVGFYGYFVDKDGKVKPAPLVANIFEYGRSSTEFPHHPFFRQSFDNGRITKAMLNIQDRYLPESES